MQSLGMDGMAYLRAGPFDAMIMEEVARKAMAEREVIDQNLANAIAVAVWNTLSKATKK